MFQKYNLSTFRKLDALHNKEKKNRRIKKALPDSNKNWWIGRLYTEQKMDKIPE